MANGKVGIVNLKELTKQIKNLDKASEKVLNATVRDFKRNAPGWVAQAVVKEYNIAAKEIKPAKKGWKYFKTGSLQVKGDTVASVAIEYMGRRLTPARFGMTPKAPKPGSAYTLKAQIKKGEKKTLGKVKKLTKKQRKNIGRNLTQQGTRNSPKSPIMLMYTGNKQPGGTNFIPFQRQSQRRDDLKTIRTISMPQMVRNEEVSKHINKIIDKELGEKFEKHLHKYMPVEDR